MSSQIEGTQATLEDVLDPLIEKNTNRNVADVVNYIRATEYAIKRLDTLPLCNRLIREALGVSYNTVSAAVKRLVGAGILKQTENASRNRTFAYRDYLDILRKGT